jgi:acyl-coenzyme A synthetase/AMP-(fatty) acid ligase
MKRAVLCVSRPWEIIGNYEKDYSLMIVNPSVSDQRLKYLLDNSDYSLLITEDGIVSRDGNDYPGEKVYWYTSGTTGDSKFFGFSSEQLQIMSKTICDTYDITANDRYFGIMPLWHGHGQGFYWAARHAGCETKFGTLANKDQIESFQPTFVTSIPDFMKSIQKLDLKCLRFVRTASQSLPSFLYQSLKDRFGVPVIEAFGMTEALSHCFTNPLHGEQRIGTVGLPSGIEFRIDDQQHLWIRGPATFYSDWFDTGDLAEQDDRGYVRILGRSIDRINVKGYKIDPLSIENQLYNEFEDIKEVAVFGRDRLKCVYVGDVDLHKVSAFLVFLGTACRPKLLQRIDEIPKNTVGKISRSLLDQHFS